MKNKTCLLICQNLRPEVDTISKYARWDNITVETFYANCLRPAFVFDISQNSMKAENTEYHLVGGSCLSGPAVGFKGSAPQIHNVGQCFNLFISESLVRTITTTGAYVLTPGWLARWRHYLDREGFSRTTAREFFSECATRLLLLDTGTDPHSSDNLRQFADYIGLPAEVIPVELDYFRRFLSRLVFKP